MGNPPHQDHCRQPFHGAQHQALDDAQDDHHGHVGGQATTGRGDDETDHDGDKHVAVAQETTQPAEQGHDQGAGQQKTCGNPLGRGQIRTEGRHQTRNDEVQAGPGEGLRGTGNEDNAGNQPLVMGRLCIEPEKSRRLRC